MRGKLQEPFRILFKQYESLSQKKSQTQTEEI